MVRFNSAGRIQPTEYRNLLQPGQCALCNRIGRTPDEIFANFSVELEYYGMLYLCQDCCNEVVDFMEAIPGEQVYNLRGEAEILYEANNRLMNENMYLRELLDVRIKSAGRGQSGGDGLISVPLPDAEQAATEVDRILNKYKSESSESGAR